MADSVNCSIIEVAIAALQEADCLLQLLSDRVTELLWDMVHHLWIALPQHWGDEELAGFVHTFMMYSDMLKVSGQWPVCASSYCLFLQNST